MFQYVDKYSILNICESLRNILSLINYRFSCTLVGKVLSTVNVNSRIKVVSVVVERSATQYQGSDNLPVILRWTKKEMSNSLLLLGRLVCKRNFWCLITWKMVFQDIIKPLQLLILSDMRFHQKHFYIYICYSCVSLHLCRRYYSHLREAKPYFRYMPPVKFSFGTFEERPLFEEETSIFK